ncbi:MAG: hypothetical protein KGS45_01750 [Planctomycetes bacterium]|nr:hypothetical protein [Planctomycetota bacterium]
MQIAAAVALTVTATMSLAVPALYPDRLSLQRSARADMFVGGSYATTPPANPNQLFFIGSDSRTNSGWTVNVSSSDMSRWGYGIIQNQTNTRLEVVIVSRSATAASLRAYAVTSGLSRDAGIITIQTDTGESFSAAVPANTGGIIGFTTNAPFNSFSVRSSLAYASIDDIVVGDAADMPNPDNCVGAITVFNGTTNFSNVDSANDLFGWRVPGNANFTAGRDVWFRWTAPETGTVDVKTLGASFDTTLALYASTTCPNAATVATDFNDDSAGLTSRIVTRVNAGQHCFIRIGGYNGATGTGPLNILFTADCPADFNNDGVIDFFAYLNFVAAFSSGC